MHIRFDFKSIKTNHRQAEHIHIIHTEWDNIYKVLIRVVLSHSTVGDILMLYLVLFYME